MVRKALVGVALAALLVLAPSAAQAKLRPGSLDRSFGHGGTITTAVGTDASGAEALALQDGKILAAGYAGSGFAVVRYRTDGSLDSAFGEGGKVTGGPGDAGAIALQPDGKILVGGRGTLARFRKEGSPDSGFGVGGSVPASVSRLALQTDGKIITADEGWAGDGYQISAVRRRSNGTLDPSFGADSQVAPHFGSDDYVGGVAVQRDGKILVAGTSLRGNTYEFALARYDPKGSPDSAFGSDGTVLTKLGREAWLNAVAVEPDGRIVAAGFADRGLNGFDFQLVRYKPNGDLDEGFGRNGKVSNPIGSGDDVIKSLALQADGKIVVAGFATRSGASDLALARYTPTGALDATFGKNGKVTTSISWSTQGRAVAVSRKGRITVAGRASDGFDQPFRFAIARYVGVICRVPSLRGERFVFAKRAIKQARCTVGRITRSFSRSLAKGRVISQRPGPKSRRAAGAKVALVVSKGKRKRR